MNYTVQSVQRVYGVVNGAIKMKLEKYKEPIRECTCKVTELYPNTRYAVAGWKKDPQCPLHIWYKSIMDAKFGRVK